MRACASLKLWIGFLMEEKDSLHQFNFIYLLKRYNMSKKQGAAKADAVKVDPKLATT